MTIQGLLTKIFKANQTPNNTVNWAGVNGLKTIQEDIVGTIRERTFFTVPTTADLLNQGFNNAILCYVQDHAFFRWQATGIPNGTTIFPANDGGVWVQETIGDTDGTVTSIGITAPAAFTVTGSPVTTSGVIDIAANGTSSQYIKGDGTLGTLPTPTGGTVTNVSALSIDSLGTDLSSTVSNPTTTPVITLSVPTASAVNRGVLSPADWTTFNSKQNAITLTTTGTSGAATLVGATLNIPQYQSVLTNPVTGTGTSGQVAYWNGTSSVTGSNNLFWDSTNNRLGIGTNSPQDKLDVNGSIRFRANTPNFSAVSDNGVLDYVPTSIFATTPQVRLAAIGTGGIAAGIKFIVGLSTTPIDAMYIAGSSNVLIGTTTDAGYKLDVNGTSVFRAQLTLVGNLSTGGNRNYIIGNNGNFEFTTNTYIIFRNWYNSGDQYLVMDYPNGGRATFSGTGGIGYRLAVGGAVTASTAIGRGLYTNPTLYAAANNDVLVGVDIAPTFTNGAFTGVTNLGLRAYSGFRLFTGGAAANSYYLEAVSSTSSNAYVNLVRNAGAAGTYAYYLNNGVAYLSVDNGSGETRLYANSGGYYLTFFSNGVERMRVPTTGNVLIGTTTDAGYKLDVAGIGRYSSTAGGYKLTVETTGGGNGNGLLVTQLGYTMLDVNTSSVVFKPFPSASGQITTNNWNSAGGSHTTFFTKNSEFTPTGYAYAIPIAKFPDANIPVVMGNTATSSLRSYLNVSGNFTAISNLAAGQQITSTLTAAANNDVLVGLDITPTFTNGAFTGVTNWGLRVASPIQVTYDSTSVSGLNLNTTVGTVGIFNNISFTTSGTLRGAFGINNQSGEFRWNSTSGGYYPTIYSNGLERMRIPTTGNVLIGTTTDAGYKLDVNGTARIQGTLALNNGNTYISNTSNNIWIAAVNSTANDVVVIPGRQLNVNSTGTYTAELSAITQIDSTTKGVLLPRMTDTQILAIASPANGLMVYSTTQNVIAFYDGTGWHKVTHTNL